MNRKITWTSLLASILTSSALAAPNAPELIATLPTTPSQVKALTVGNGINAAGNIVPSAYFVVEAPDQQTAYVWVSDGTTAGTHQASSASAVYAYKGVFASPTLGAFFLNDVATSGDQIFRTDGPIASSRQVTDGTSPMSLLGLLDGQPVSYAPSAPNTWTVWSVDGNTGAHTVLASMPGPYPLETVLTDHTGIAITPLPSPNNAYQITSFSADAAATALPAPPPSTFWLYPHRAGAGATLACAQSITPTSSQELYCTDGTVQGTRRPVPPITGTGVPLMDTTVFFPLGNRLMFFAVSPVPTIHMTPWITDGTDAGTIPLLDEDLGNFNVCSDDRAGGLYFQGYVHEENRTPIYLWYTDGTRANTRRVLELVAPVSCFMLGTAKGRGQIAFLQLGETLYQTNGTADTTHPVPSAPPLTNPLSYSSHIQGVAALGRWLIFYAPVSATQLGLWRLDLDPIFVDGFEAGAGRNAAGSLH